MYPVIEQRRQVDHGIPGLHAVGEGDSGSWQDICTLENEILVPGGRSPPCIGSMHLLHGSY